MFSDVPKRTKVLFISLAVSLFACSVIYAAVFLSGAISEDEAFMYAAIFAAAALSLNGGLLAIGYIMLRKTRSQFTRKKCVSCGRSIGINAKACPGCRAMQPPALDSSVYLEPHEREDTVTKK